ncbi:MAG: TadE family protein [Gemmatales bacterium]
MRILHRHRHGFVRKRAGVAVVETAVLLLPIFVMTLFGVWEVGRLVQLQQIIANAAREGARQASTGSRSSSSIHPEIPFNPNYEVQLAVRNYLINSGIPMTYGSPAVPVPYTIRVQNVTTGTIADYNADVPGPTPVSDPVSASVQDINNNKDILSVTVTYPYLVAKWSPGQFFVSNARVISATAKWYSLKDIPITVDTSIPGAPIP